MPDPEFEFGGFFTIILRRPRPDEVGIKAGISDGIKVGINETQKKILEIIESEPRATASEIAEQIGISTRKTEANIAALRDKGVLIREGSKKTGEWRIDLDKIKRL